MKQLPQDILEQRLDILLNKVRGLAEAAYQAQVGSVQEVLMESADKGRSSGSFWVKTRQSHPVGSIVRAEIEKCDGTLLFARNEL
jgi:tRNA A37 methylthiotransferase MiaB